MFESRLCLLSTFGRGRGSLVKTHFSTANTGEMENQRNDDLDKRVKCPVSLTRLSSRNKKDLDKRAGEVREVLEQE